MRYLLVLFLLGCGIPPAKTEPIEFSPLTDLATKGRYHEINLVFDRCLDEYADEIQEAKDILDHYGIHIVASDPTIWRVRCRYDEPSKDSDWVGLANLFYGIDIRMPYFERSNSVMRVSLLMHESIHLLGVGHNKYFNSVMNKTNHPNLFLTEADIHDIDVALQDDHYDMSDN